MPTLSHALTWIACLALGLVVNRYVQRWMARGDDAGTGVSQPHDDAAEPSGATTAPVVDRPWLRSIWGRR
jgi:hypothetical protein